MATGCGSSAPSASRKMTWSAAILAGGLSRRFGSPKYLFAGADLPFLSRDLVSHLVGKCRGFDAAVPFYKGFYEPACAVYTRRFLPVLSRYRLDPKGPVSRCFEEPGIDVARVTEEEIRAFGDPDLLFLNVNTKEDLARAEALLASRRGELN